MEDRQPLISVITVSYNAKSTIEETILSIINQNYINIEYIIVDGGSNDGTKDIISKYSQYISYCISEPDNGVYDAMNKGLKVANGDWCIFIGADDVFYSTTILQEISRKLKNDDKIYYGDVILESNSTRYMGEVSSVYQLCKQNICHQSIFYPKKVYKNKEYNNHYRIFADYVYNLELYKENPNNFEYIDNIISIFASSGISSNTSEYNSFQEERKKIIKKLFGLKTYYISILLSLVNKIYKKIVSIQK